MTLREILSGTSHWLRSHRFEPAGRCRPALDNDGLLAINLDDGEEYDDRRGSAAPSAPVVVSTVAAVERREPAEKLQEGLDRLVDQLQRINNHLSEQLAQHQELMGRVRQLPQLLESLPSAVENQKQLTSRLMDQLRVTAAKDQQFTDAVARIPAEAARQTDALTRIDHQLAAAAESDVQLGENFVRFRDTLERLNHNTMSNTEGIVQMSRTFAASDRYLKEVIARLNKRYAWVLAGAVSVCLLVISSLIGVIVYLAR
jgi:predicted nuclease with TOPRIM domain